MNDRLDDAQGFAFAARRVIDVTAASFALVTNVLAHVERLVTDVVEDSADVVRESEALARAAAEAARSVRAAVRATPRFARITGEALGLVAAYQIEAARTQALAADEAPLRAGAPAGDSPSDRRRRRRDAAQHELHVRSAERLYRLCVELRGAVLKAGQFGSSRMDLLPEPYVVALSRLQDRVPAVPFEGIAARIEDELGAPLDKLFASFEQEPIAAASLAQVHAATLDDGTRVAVKVLVPGIEDVVEIDLAAVRVLAAVLRDSVAEVDLTTIADEMGRSVREELDFRLEAERACKLAESFADDDAVVVPRIFPARSARGVLTMARVDGERLTDFLEACAHGGEAGAAERDALLGLVVRATCAQILEHGLFQADPHPGNFLVLRGRGALRLALLDFGAVQELSPTERRAYRGLAAAIVGRDHERTAELLHALGFATRSGEVGPLLDFADLMLDVFRPDPARPLAEVDPLESLTRGLAAVRANPVVRLPQHFILLGRVFATLGGLLVRYRPRIDLFSILAPHLMP